MSRPSAGYRTRRSTLQQSAPPPLRFSPATNSGGTLPPFPRGPLPGLRRTVRATALSEITQVCVTGAGMKVTTALALPDSAPFRPCSSSEPVGITDSSFATQRMVGAFALDAQTRDALVIIGEDPSALHYVRVGKKE